LRDGLLGGAIAEGGEEAMLSLGLGRRQVLHRDHSMPARGKRQSRGGIGVSLPIVAHVECDGAPQQRPFRPRHLSVEPREADDPVVRDDADASHAMAVLINYAHRERGGGEHGPTSHRARDQERPERQPVESRHVRIVTPVVRRPQLRRR